MPFMNEYDVQRARAVFRRNGWTLADEANDILARLMIWTNENSDGWGYWSQPSRAAAKLVDRISETADGAWEYDSKRGDMSESDCKKALIPVKSFLTRQGVDVETRRWILEGGPR